MPKDEEVNPLEPIENAPPGIKKIITLVLQLERDKLYQKKPHINADVLKIVKQEIIERNLEEVEEKIEEDIG